MRKSGMIGVALCLMLLLAAVAPAAQRRRGKPKPKPAVVCGDPTATCRTTVEFQPHQLPFRLAADAVIYDTEKFYAIILKSVRDSSGGQNCDVFVPESERIEAQALFPHNKVFASRCFDPGDMYYAGVAQNQQFMAVFAGRTRAEANAMLAKVKATGKYAGANLRRMHAGFNGT